MKKRVPISQVMTKELVLLNTNDSLEKAETLFKKNSIRHIPVVENNKVKGMFSYTDLLKVSIAETKADETIEPVVYNMYTLDQVMVKDVKTVNAADTVQEVAEIITKNNFHAVPVEEEGKLVGIVSTTDLINYLLDQY